MNPYNSILDRLINPHSRIKNVEKVQRSRLLSMILLTILLLGTMILLIVLRHDPHDIQSPEVRGAFLILGIALTMYIINRLGYNRYAIGGLVVPFAIIFTYIAFFIDGKAFFIDGKAVFLAFLLIPILLTAIFFPFRWTIIFSALILLIILILLSLQDQVSPSSPFWSLRNMWFFLLLSTGLILTFMWHLKNLEQIRKQELQNINIQLEQKIADLERFTYTVSHELKNPVVTIKAFLGSVDKDIELGNIKKAHEDLSRIENAADHLHHTLSDLLELSRIGRVEKPFEEISVKELVYETLEVLGGKLQSKDILIRVSDKLPNVYGDRPRLREVFENLIDNAIKYMGSQKKPVIEIGVRELNNPIFFVQDNGISIEFQYQEKIFELFEKLDPTSEGTGVGLALVKRIIETHGGQIWVESEGDGKGSRFCFTISDEIKIGK